MSDGRNLRILIIDDEPDLVAQTRPDLELYGLDVLDLRATRISRQTGPCLSEWEQLVGLLQMESSQLRQFDLLLSDILFVQDGTAPLYPPDWDPKQARSEECPNALGLLYALAVLAYRKGDPAPFGWAVRSANGAAAMNDPIAIACYGLIQGLRGRIDITPNLRDDTSRKLGELRGKTIHPTWKEALKDYRRELIAGARDHRFTVSFSCAPSEWAHPTSSTPSPDASTGRQVEPQRLANGCRRDELTDVVLNIGVRGALQRIRVASLFADCITPDAPDEFSAALVKEHALPWLRDIAPLMWPAAADLWQTWQAFKPGPLDQDLDGRELVAIASLLWLRKCCIRNRMEKLTPTAITGYVYDQMGIVSKAGSAEYKAVNEKIKLAVGSPLRGVAERLVKGTFPGDEYSAIGDVGRLLLRELGWRGDEPDFPDGFRITSSVLNDTDPGGGAPDGAP